MSWDELRGAAGRILASAVERDADLANLRLEGIGWATVDADRARSELDSLLGGASETSPGTTWQALERHPALGARAWLRTRAGAAEQARTEPGDPNEAALIALEPDTEGRLAASLARFGEGVAVIYVGNATARPGDFIRGRLVRGGASWGPHVVVLDEPEP